MVVAVIDTGLYAAHPDLAANVWTNPGEVGTDALGRDKRTNAVDDDGNGYVDDWQGLGFHRTRATTTRPTSTATAPTSRARSPRSATTGVGIIGVAP